MFRHLPTYYASIIEHDRSLKALTNIVIPSVNEYTYIYGTCIKLERNGKQTHKQNGLISLN